MWPLSSRGRSKNELFCGFPYSVYVCIWTGLMSNIYGMVHDMMLICNIIMSTRFNTDIHHMLGVFRIQRRGGGGGEGGG